MHNLIFCGDYGMKFDDNVVGYHFKCRSCGKKLYTKIIPLCWESLNLVGEKSLYSHFNDHQNDNDKVICLTLEPGFDNNKVFELYINTYIIDVYKGIRRDKVSALDRILYPVVITYDKKTNKMGFAI